MPYLKPQLDPEEAELFARTQRALQTAIQEGWTLRQLLGHILEHLVHSHYDSFVFHFVKHRYFFLGRIKFEFNLDMDSEPLEIDDHYSLNFRIAVLDEKGAETKVLRDDLIYADSFVYIFRVPEFNEEIPALEKAAEIALAQTFSPLDMERKEGLGSYVESAFGQDLNQYQQLDYEGLLLYLGLNAARYKCKACSEEELQQISLRLGIPIPLYYEKFLRVVGLNNHFAPDLLTKIEDYQPVHRNDHSFVFAQNMSSDFYLGIDNEPPYTISEEWTRENTYGDGPYSTFQSFPEYLIECLDAFHA